MLFRLADVFPSSRFAQEDASGLRAMSSTWADELSQVPALAIPELHKRTMSRYTSTFAPSIGDYRATWLDPAWDFWAEFNAKRDDEDDRPAIEMLTEGPRETDGPGLTAGKLQMARVASGRAMITCECVDLSTGIYKGATLTPDKTLWVCARGECDFSLDIERSDSAPHRPRLERADAKTRSKFETLGKISDALATGRATVADMRRAAEACDIDLGAMEPNDHAEFCGWVNWFRRTNPNTPMSYTVLTLTWTKYQEDRQERWGERLQA